ncbi:MAG: PilZ domain-containing protein [Desulfobacteraceae bacterium]|jgi:c-di-GMP-binding flagellar brake protein YcgR
MTFEEKRKYPRLDLRIDDGYFGNFKLANDETIAAPIVNISAGGLNIAAPESTKESIKSGDQILLASIAGGTNFAFLADVVSEVRWVKQLDTPGYLSVGCKFKNLSEELRNQLKAFVEAERKTRGQYG